MLVSQCTRLFNVLRGIALRASSSRKFQYLRGQHRPVREQAFAAGMVGAAGWPDAAIFMAVEPGAGPLVGLL